MSVYTNIVIIGSAGSGKSTLAGSLLVHCGAVGARNVEKVFKCAAEIGKPTAGLAFLMDVRKLERERGTTIDGNIRKLQLPGGGPLANVMDAPGQRAWRRRTLSMIQQADLVVMCVADDTLVDDMSELLALCYFFRVRNLAVAITRNTVDDKRVMAAVSRAGFFIGKVPVFAVRLEPGCTFHGVAPLVDWMCAQPPPLRDTTGDLIILVNRVFKISGVGTVICGGIVKGRLRVGEHVMIVPGMCVIPVASIEVWRESVSEATAGSQVGIVVKNFSVNDFKKGWNGFVAGHVGGSVSAVPMASSPLLNQNIRLTDYTPSPAHVGHFSIPQYTMTFVVDVVVVRNTLGLRALPLEAGAAVLVASRMSTHHARVVSLIARLNNSFEAVEFHPTEVTRRGIYRMQLKSHIGMVVDEKDKCEPFSRVVLSDNIGVVAAGVVRATGMHTSETIAMESGTPFATGYVYAIQKNTFARIVPLTADTNLDTVTCVLMGSKSPLLGIVMSHTVPVIVSVSTVSPASVKELQKRGVTLEAIEFGASSRGPLFCAVAASDTTDGKTRVRRFQPKKKVDQVGGGRGKRVGRGGAPPPPAWLAAALVARAERREERDSAFGLPEERDRAPTTAATHVTLKCIAGSSCVSRRRRLVLPIDVLNIIVDFAAHSVTAVLRCAEVSVAWALATDRDELFHDVLARYQILPAIPFDDGELLRTSPLRRAIAASMEGVSSCDGIINGPFGGVRSFGGGITPPGRHGTSLALGAGSWVQLSHWDRARVVAAKSLCCLAWHPPQPHRGPILVGVAEGFHGGGGGSGAHRATVSLVLNFIHSATVGRLKTKQ